MTVEKCIQCGICRVNCPFFKLILKESVSPRGLTLLAKKQIATPAFYYCTLCKACEIKCPLNLKLCDAFRKARLILAEKGKTTKENKEMIGYIQCNYTKNPYSKLGYIDDLFVLKKFRRKGIATKLIVEFTKILKKKGYKKLQMSVNTRNTNAISLYKKLGFEIFHYGLRKEWK